MDIIQGSILNTLVNFSGLYTGAIFIALLSSIIRLFYGVDELNNRNNYFFTFLRYFFMSLGITLLMVHIGFIKGWSNDEMIIISGASAFLSSEIITIIIDIFPRIIKKWLNEKFGLSNGK